MHMRFKRAGKKRATVTRRGLLRGRATVRVLKRR
jgi:hypothetical protein